MDPEITLKELKKNIEKKDITEKEFRNFCLDLKSFLVKNSTTGLWSNFSHASKSLLVNLISKTCEHGFLPDYNGSDELESESHLSFSKSDWGSLSLSTVSQAVSWLLCEDITEDTHLLEKAVIPIFILCYTHSMQEEWTTPKLKETSFDLIKLFGDLYFKQSEIKLGDFVKGTSSKLHSQGIFNPLLLFFQTKLRKDNWRNNRCTKNLFYYVLSHASPEKVSANIDTLFPPSLLFVDDFNVKNQILGIRCLHKIIHDVSGAELRLDGKAEVIYSALHKLSYVREAELMEVLHPCLLKIISVLENPYRPVDFIIKGAKNIRPIGIKLYLEYKLQWAIEEACDAYQVIESKSRHCQLTLKGEECNITSNAQINIKHLNNVCLMANVMSICEKVDACLNDPTIELEASNISISSIAKYAKSPTNFSLGNIFGSLGSYLYTVAIIGAAIIRWTKYDSMINRILTDMEMEQRLVLRKAYSQQLPLYIDEMGPHSVKHLKRFMVVLCKYLEVYEGSEELTRKNMLNALHKFLSNTWFQHFAFIHIEELLKSLLKLLYDIDENDLSDNVRNELSHLLSICLKCLKDIDPNKFDVICSCINFEMMPPSFMSRWKLCFEHP
ncbi:TELO2-interacting protein 2 [Nymphon striatum]|nr:TELO2-interacting protein 2 [Nymphon striatum]